MGQMVNTSGPDKNGSATSAKTCLKDKNSSQSPSAASSQSGSNGVFQRGARGRRSSTRVGRLPSMPEYSKPVTFRYEIQHHTGRMQKITNAFAVYRLTVLTVACVILGLALGLVCRLYSNDWTERHFMYIEFPGELYLRLLKLLIVPLLVSNVILSFGSIQGKLSSHLGKLASLLYLMSNCLAILVAVVFVLLISPGKQRASIVSKAGSSLEGLNATLASEIDINIVPEKEQQKQQALPKFLPIDNNKINQNVPRPPILPISNSSISKINNSINYEDTWIQPAPKRRVSNTHQIEGKTNQTNDTINIPIVFDLVRLPTTPSSTNSALNNDDQIVIHSTPKPIEAYGGSSQPRIDQKVVHTNHSHNGQGQYHQHFNTYSLGTNLPADILLDILRNLVPDNLVATALYQTKTRLLTPSKMIIGANGTTDPPASRWPIVHVKIEQANIIGLLACSVLIGVVLSHMGEAGKPLLDLCACLSELSLRIGMIAINLTPFCIMFLLIGQIARTRDLSSTIGELCMYLVTVLSALSFHGFILMPAIYWAITRKMPMKFLQHQLDVLVASFATSSSSSTLALLLRNLIQYNINPVIVRAFGPLGSVFNMNGTTIYEVVGCVFLAQKMGADLTISSILLIGLASAVAGLSTVGVPSSGMMTIVIVLDAINLPVLTLSLIYIVDFVVDRFRTVVNVWTGSIVVALIDDLCPESLFDEATEHNKFLEKWKFKTLAKRGSLKKSRMSIVGAPEVEDQSKSQVISVTITPPLENSGNNKT